MTSSLRMNDSKVLPACCSAGETCAGVAARMEARAIGRTGWFGEGRWMSELGVGGDEEATLGVTCGGCLASLEPNSPAKRLFPPNPALWPSLPSVSVGLVEASAASVGGMTKSGRSTPVTLLFFFLPSDGSEKSTINCMNHINYCNTVFTAKAPRKY